MIVFATLAIFMNIMDSVTTELAMRQYPEKDLKNEANPIARKIMLKSKLLMTILKQISLPLMLIYLVHTKDLFTLKFLAVALSLVVLNNSFIYLSRRITKRKIISPAKVLQKLLYTPEKLVYPMILLVIFGLTALIMLIL